MKKKKKRKIQTLETLHSLTVFLEFSKNPQNLCSIKHYLYLSLAFHVLQTTDRVSPAEGSFFTLFILQ